MLSASEIAAMREAQEAALPDTCTILRRTLTNDGQGGYVETWSEVATGVKCRLVHSNLAPRETVIAERAAGRTVWQLTVPYGTDISRTDRVVVNGVTYEILAVWSGGTWETARRVVLAKVD